MKTTCDLSLASLSVVSGLAFANTHSLTHSLPFLFVSLSVFSQSEATEVFFSCTKLFQSSDANLRRLVYLMIKALPPGSDEVIIVTSSLMKDMTSNSELYKGNSIRVLCRILDSSL